jgi:hypothetical protein
MRLVDLVPGDIDLLLSIALWNYNFGLDNNAHQYLEKAKTIAPFDIRVLQVEILINYGQSQNYILSLCNTALTFFPDNKWILDIKQKIQKTGQLTEMVSPPLNLRWHRG